MTDYAHMTDAEAFRAMCDDGTLFGPDDEVDTPMVNLNDTFCYACGDGEPVTPEELPTVVDIYRKHGPIGCICWAAKKRNEDPVVEYTEDPVYQATWVALYGNSPVDDNRCNKVEPRWSSRHLHLSPWDPSKEPTEKASQ